MTRQQAAGSDRRVAVGRIGKAHGVRGEVSVDVRTDDPETRFAAGSTLQVDRPGAPPLTVVRSRPHHGRLLVTFEGVGDRTAAEALRGLLLLVDVDADVALQDPDEFYDHQLIGLTVVTVSGQQVGEVADVVHLPGSDLLAVRRADGGEALVPFVRAIVPTVDLAAGRAVIDPPDGLLDLNDGAPGAHED